MEIPAERWSTAIRTRGSRRVFDGLPIPHEAWTKLSKTCNEFRPFKHARAVLVHGFPSNLFKGVVGPYGKIRGAASFIAFIGDMDSPNVQEEVGYTGEGIILEVESLGLNTCWVGGFFRHEVAASLLELHRGERILAVTPVGYATEQVTMSEKLMTGFGWTHRRKPLSSMVVGLKEADWPDWVGKALEAARAAPSAVNRQPWLFEVEAEGITVSVNRPGMEFVIAKRLDCGIAMVHMEVVALECGRRGTWEFLEAPEVARFNVVD